MTIRGGCDGGIKAYDEQASLQGDMMDSYKGNLNLWFCLLMARYLRLVVRGGTGG